MLVLVFSSGLAGWSIANKDMALYWMQMADLQHQLEQCQQTAISPIPEYKTPMSDEEHLEMILERFIDGIDTANITFEFDNSGYSKGFISIYYDRLVDETYTPTQSLTPEPVFPMPVDPLQPWRDPPLAP